MKYLFSSYLTLTPSFRCLFGAQLTQKGAVSIRPVGINSVDWNSFLGFSRCFFGFKQTAMTRFLPLRVIHLAQLLLAQLNFATKLTQQCPRGRT